MMARVCQVMVRSAVLARASASRLPIVTLSGCQRYTSISGSHNYEVKRDKILQQLKPTEYFNFARDIVAPWADRKPNHMALLLTDGQNKSVLTYQSLMTDARKLAGALSDPRPPTCALVLLPKVSEWWVVNVAAAWCGTILSPGTTHLSPSDVTYRLEQSRADCIICTAALAEVLHHVTSALPCRILLPDGPHDQIREGWVSYHKLLESGVGGEECVTSKGSDVTQLFFTSGTTGRPKMVPHTHTSYGIGHISTARYWLDLGEEDVVWNLSDTGWAKAAWSSLYAPFIAGATAFVHMEPRFNAEEVLRTLREQPITVLCAPPTAYRALLQCGSFSSSSFPTLRHCVSAGEPLNPEAMHTWTKNTGLSIYEGYGQSETTLLAGVVPGMKLRPGSMGRPAPGYTLAVVDNSQQELGPHQEGHLAVSLKNGNPVGLFKGYMNDSARTQKVFVGGYYLTGDRAYYDEDGYFWFVGRADDVIISSGYRIGPFEVESCLLEHPAVAESAVVSSPDSLRGEVVKAFVVLVDGYKDEDPDELRTSLQLHVKENAAPYKYPRKIEFLEALPKTVSGKIRRVELRNQEWGRF